LKLAAVDIGTNSTRLLVAEVSEKGQVKEVLKLGKVTKLGKGIKQTKRISPESMARTLDTLREFKKIIEEHNVEKVIVATTEAARLAENAEEFIKGVRNLGFDIEILSDKEEAELVFKANLLSFNIKGKDIMTVDLGGGSTEIVYGSEREVLFSKSLKFGVVLLNEEFLRSDPPKSEELKSLESYLRNRLLEVKPYIGNSEFEVFAVGGTITSVVAMEERMTVYDSQVVHGYKVTKDIVEKWYRKLTSMKEEERKNVAGLEKSRSDVIIPGLAFFKVFCEVFGKEKLTVSERGLLYGLLLKEVENCQVKG